MRHPVNFAILEAFRAHHEGSPFLPKLQSLRLTTYHLRFVDLLLAPSLTSVSFDFGLCWNTHEEHELLEAVLIDAGARCPYLQEFLVESSRTSASSAGDAALEPFAHLLPMRQYPPSLQAGDIIRLASIPRLQRACFRVSSIADVPSRSQMQHIVAFHSLSDLELHVRSLEIATALLELLQTPCLEALTVHVDNLPEPLTFSAFCVALRSVASPATFHSLKLNGGGTNSPGAGGAPRTRTTSALDGCILAPVLSLSGMRVLQIRLPMQCKRGDDVVLRMEASWPALASLEIGTHLKWHPSSGVTLSEQWSLMS